jgi:hypothetical protein
LCIANATKGVNKLQHILGHSDSKWKCWLEFIKLYGYTIPMIRKRVKAPGQKAQRCVGEFAIETARQRYDVYVTNHALRGIEKDFTSTMRESYHSDYIVNQVLPDDDAVPVELSGKYSLVITNDMFESMKNGDIYVD